MRGLICCAGLLCLSVVQQSCERKTPPTVVENVPLVTENAAPPVPAAVAEHTETHDPYDIGGLPQTFTETIPPTQIDFEMILVPGDREKRIEPFYIGKYEVTWNEFAPWLLDYGARKRDARGDLPSFVREAPIQIPHRGFDMENRPALGVTSEVILRFCTWLGQHTNRSYAISTHQQWLHAYELGGGIASEMITDSYAEEHAVYFENSWNDEASPAGGWTTRKPGSKRANGLGIHDMLGNVAELIIMEDGRTGFVGGHCESEANELGPTIIFEPSETLQHGFRPSYPDWVYHDGPPCGLRLICSAKSVRKTLGQQNNAPTQQNE